MRGRNRVAGFGRSTRQDRDRPGLGNTEENARFAKAVADPKPGEHWLLITSAFHMPRAVGIFRKIGFAVEPYPVDFKTRGWIDVLTVQDDFIVGLVCGQYRHSRMDGVDSLSAHGQD